MTWNLQSIVDLERHPVGDDKFLRRCKSRLDESGVLVLHGFMQPEAIASVCAEGEQHRHLAWYTTSAHNIYLAPADPAYPMEHPRNREVSSSKGCITTDQIPRQSVLHALYDAEEFRGFLCAVLGETALYEYADPLSSVNLHFADKGQELGWHFDNSSFAITLLVQQPDGGGEFQYVRDVRDADRGEMNYDQAAAVLDGKTPPTTLALAPGALVLFRGRNSMHRVTPVEGDRTRMLVVLAYNSEPGISLSESARMTFYGRLG